jgi:hypothetical protein
MKVSLSWFTGFRKKEENNNHCHNSKSELPLTARQAEIAFSGASGGGRVNPMILKEQGVVSQGFD